MVTNGVMALACVHMNDVRFTALRAVIIGLSLAGCAPRPAAPPPAAPSPADSAAVDTVVARPPIDTGVPVPPPAGPVIPAPDPADTMTVRVCSGGDVMLGSNLDTTWVIRARRTHGRRVRALPDPGAVLAPLAPLVADADVVLLNVEGAIGEGPAPSKCRRGSRNCYAFRQPTAAAAALRALHPGARIVGNLANNHARDAGPAGLARTVRALREADVHVTGADSVATEVVTARGDTLLVLGFGTSWAFVGDLDQLRRWVTRAAERHPRVVVTMHLGAEGPGAQRTGDSTEMFLGYDRGNPVAFARTAIEAGARLLVGHGPHVMRAMEWRDSAFVAYSLGNLLTYGPFSLGEPSNRGGILCASVPRRGAPRNVIFHPTVQRPPGLVAADPAGRAAILVDSLSALDFPASGAKLARTGHGWAVRSPD